MSGRIGYNLVLSIADAAVGGVIDLKGPQIAGRVVKGNSNDNENLFDLFVASFVDPGKVTFNCLAESANTLALFALIGGTDSSAISITRSDGKVWSGQCYVLNLADGEPLEELATIDIECQITGKPSVE